MRAEIWLASFFGHVRLDDAGACDTTRVVSMHLSILDDRVSVRDQANRRLGSAAETCQPLEHIHDRKGLPLPTTRTRPRIAIFWCERSRLRSSHGKLGKQPLASAISLLVPIG